MIMTGASNRSSGVAVGVRILGAFWLACLPAAGTGLDDRIKVFKEAGKQTEPEVTAVLEAGLNEGRSAQALAAVKAWLSTETTDNTVLIYKAALVAERAGDASFASGLYRKLLMQQGIDGKLATESLASMMRLLGNQLGDSDSAYLFLKQEGKRLRPVANTARYDRWFLEQATQRRDWAGMANCLAQIHNGQEPLDASAPQLTRLLDEVETYKHTSEEVVTALRALAAAARTTPEVKARLLWAAEIAPLSVRILATLKDKRKINEASLNDALKAAETLVAVLPFEGSLLVANGWMNFDLYHNTEFVQAMEVGRAAKAAPILQAMRKLSPDQARQLLSHSPQQSGGGRSVAQYLFSMPELRRLVAEVPPILNSLDAPNVPLFDASLTPADAKVLAPQLVRNPHIDAAIIRVFAASDERRYTAVIDAMMKTEMWRTADIKAVGQRVWNAGVFERGKDKEDAPIKKHASLDARFQGLKKQVERKAATNDRMAAFKALMADLSGTPSIPGAFALWGDLFANAPAPDAIAMFKEIKSDELFRVAASKVQFGKAGRLPWQAVAPHNHPQYHQQETRKLGADLIAHAAQQIRAQMGSGTVSETMFGIWLHAVDPKSEEAKKLLTDLVASPAWQKLGPVYRATAARDTYFGSLATVRTANPWTSTAVSRELRELPDNAAPAVVEAAFKSVVTRALQAPTPVEITSLQKVAALPAWSDETRRLVFQLFREAAPLGAYSRAQGYEALVMRVAKELGEKGDWAQLEPVIGGLWHAAAATEDERLYNGADALSVLAEKALDANQPSIAMSLTRAGSSGPTAKALATRKEPAVPAIIARLRTVSGKAAGLIGAVEITVDETDPAFAIHKSNAEFVLGNLDSAWQLYLEHAGKLQVVMRTLPVDYSMWLLERNIQTDRDQNAENLVKDLTIWAREAPGTLSLEQDARLKVSYADLAFRKGALPTARAWYRKVAEAAEYDGMEMQLIAALGSVRVDRVTKNFGAAMTELDKLMKLSNPEFRKKVRYARAEVLMDQESFAEALDEIEHVLRQEPKHPDALILRGKIHYQMRKLVEASEIELGPSQDKTVIVPGEAVKINLRDPTLNISGVGADIEVEIRAKSGDSERVLLYQLGDSKEKFRAEVATALGPPTPGDKVLQILGDDEIRYGYSARFRAKMKDLPADPDVVIHVASDARLSASSGAFPPREGQRKLDIEELGLSTSQAALGTRAVRPGNPIYLRVTDSDRSVTPHIDEVFVSLTTTSGDEIRKLVLKETTPFSGEFEGSIPTSPAQAMAYATDNAPGRDPNMAISSVEYPGWQGSVGEGKEIHVFGVNLNDNAAPGKLTIDSGGADQQLTRFLVQTSMNGKDWVTRARVPDDNEVWDGRPHVSSFPTFGNHALAISAPKGREIPADWHEIMDINAHGSSAKFLSKHVRSLSADKLPLVETSHPGYSVLFQYRALFHQPTAAIRRFQVTGLPPMPADGKGVGALLLIDGVPAAADAENPLLIERELAPGLHEIQIWGHLGRTQIMESKPVLLCDVPGKQELQACPDSMFDPAGFPETARTSIPQPADVRSAADGSWEVTFGDRTQARLIRFAILEHKGIAPSIRKVTLNNREGKALLPVAQDFMNLRTNEQLEVVPGDQIAVRYEDPRPVTPKRTRHEDRLKVAFNNAVISASFLNYQTNKEGERELVLEAIRRFRYDDAIAVVVEDPDMDSSENKDIVEVKVTSTNGGTATIQAVETEEHSGRFLGRVFPVPGEPARASEIKVAEGGGMTLAYHDAENLDPGIAATRSVELQHAGYKDPVLESYPAYSEALPAPKVETDPKSKTAAKTPALEVVAPRFTLNYKHAGDAKGPHDSLAGSSLCFDVVSPHLALARSSTIHAYVQTESGRKKANVPGSTFDPAVPGTLKLTGTLGRPALVTPAGYQAGRPPLPPTNTTPLEEGRFSFAIPLFLGDLPDRSFATTAAEALTDDAIPDGLAVRTGDIVHVGYAFEGPDGKVMWKTSSYTVGSKSILDVMQANYSGPLDRAFVGEKIYLRVIDPAGDQTPNRDTLKVSLKSAAGAATDYELQETEAHSGIFKSVFSLSFADGKLPAQLPPVALNGFPVRYGDDVMVSYSGQSFQVAVNMGADGGIEPFSKRFTGDEMAVTTGFTLAECFFELAKKHREMEQESLARREMAQARKLLAEAVASHRSDELKAQAEYLLGNLAQEYADLSKNEDAKLPMYQDALARFTKVAGDYPDSEFAPKSQFKTALVYEKMKETENAVEEYVKLAYKYPDHELIPSVMSRLGGYYQAKGTEFKQQADAIRDKEDDASKAEVLRLDALSYPQFLNAAMVFAKLRERFPQDPLAGLAGLRAGQNYMRAHQYQKAIKILKPVFENEEYDDKEVRSQALYWSGISHERYAGTLTEDNYRGRGDAIKEAYATYRRVTFDFPDSIWAKYSRGRLADPVFAQLVKQENDDRERMIEALKEERKKRR
jgi:tetratricopeptide (TPR) repeat protein